MKTACEFVIAGLFGALLAWLLFPYLVKGLFYFLIWRLFS